MFKEYGSHKEKKTQFCVFILRPQVTTYEVGGVAYEISGARSDTWNISIGCSNLSICALYYIHPFTNSIFFLSGSVRPELL